MKKIISMLLAVVMIVACMATVAFAAEPETVTVTFVVKNNPGFAALGAYLDYDKDALTLVEMESGFLGGTMLTNVNTGKMGYASATDNTDNGILVTATFELTNVEAGNTYTVELVIEYLTNAAREVVDAEDVFTATVHEIVIEEPECEHKNVEIIPGKAATCEETGLTEGKVCADCGEVLVAQEVIPALGHKEEVIKGKAATCTEAGLTDGLQCSVCGKLLKAQEEIAPLGHKEEVIPGKAATCTEAGLTDGLKCSVCGEILKAQEVIAPLGHDWTEEVWEVVLKPTATEEGKEELVRYCKICGEREVLDTRTIAPTGLDDEPNTGDFTPVLAMFAIVVMMVPCLLVKKFRAVK